MNPVRTGVLAALLFSGLFCGPGVAAATADDAPAPAPAPAPPPGSGGSSLTGAPAGGAPAPAEPPRGPSLPPPPSPLPSKDPTHLRVELRAGGPRRTCQVATLKGRLVEESTGRILREGPRFSARIDGAPGGALRVDGAAVAGPAVTVVPAAGGTFTLGTQGYTGSLRIGGAPDGTLRLVVDCPLEDYLCGVLAGELFPDSPPEALRALAVLARSFALSHLPDLSDDPGLHQAFRGVPAATILPVLSAAVAATAGMRLVDGKGGPLPNYWYHSTCGGHTADASAVFGVPATEAYGGVPCARCVTSRYWQWEIEVPEKDLRRALRFGSAVAKLEVGSRSIDGRLLTFRATAAGGTVRYVPALSVRQALGANVLRSTLVTAIAPVERAGAASSWRIAGRGWGHGVGLCQVGACALAKEGWTAERILAYYYPGTRIVRAVR